MVEIIVVAITMLCFILWFDIEGSRSTKKALREIEKRRIEMDQ